MSDPGKRGLIAGLGVGAALLACCALPALLTAGALGALGGIFSSPWLWAASGAALAIALTRTVSRLRSRGSTQDNSSAPPQGDEHTPPPHQHGNGGDTSLTGTRTPPRDALP